MSVLIKRFFLALLVLILVLIGGLLLLLATLDPNQFKPVLKQQLYRQTGLTLVAEGDWQWQFLPVLAVEIGKTEFHTSNTFNKDTLLAKLDSIALSVNWQSLLSPRIEITSLNINGLQLRLVSTSTGNNWELLPPPTHTGTSSSPENETTSTSKAFDAVTLQSLSALDTQIELFDTQTHSHQILQLKEFTADNFNLEGNSFNLTTALQFKSQTAQPIALTLNSPAQINLKASSLSLDAIQGVVEQSRINGHLHITMADTVHIDSELQIDQITPANYVLDSTSSPASAHKEQTDAASTATELPLEWLHLLEGKLALAINKLHINKATINKLKLIAQLNNSVLHIPQLSAEVFDGELQFSATLDNRQSPAKLETSQQLHNIAIDQALKYFDAAIDLRGNAQLSSTLNSQGNTTEQLLGMLNGNTQLALLDTYFGDDNIDLRACQAIALIRKEALGSDWPAGTEFTQLTANIDWHHGIGTITTMTAATPSFFVSGNGQYSLLDNHFDIRLGATLNTTNPDFENQLDPGCLINKRYQNIAWPLRCSGDSDNPRCKVDNTRLEKAAKKYFSEKAKSKAKEKIQKKLTDKLGESLGGDLSDALQNTLDKLLR